MPKGRLAAALAAASMHPADHAPQEPLCPRRAAAAFVEVVRYQGPTAEQIAAVRGPPAPTLDEVAASYRNGGPTLTIPTPPGRPLPCQHGTDYGKPCPFGWKRTGLLMPECQAPPGFIFSPACLQQTGGASSISGSLSRSKKKRIEMQCSVSWPCAGENNPGEQTDYRATCPDGWTLSQDGSCLAPAAYSGSCQRRQNFLAYTPGMKATWSANCDVAWPVTKRQPEESAPNPLDRADVRNAVWARCSRDYSARCPIGFRFDADGICQAPSNYFGKATRLCASVDARRLTPEMKAAFEKSCAVRWPCVGDSVQAYMAAAGPLLLGLAFL